MSTSNAKHPTDQIASAISKSISSLFDLEVSSEEILPRIEIPKDTNHGHFAFPCFSLAKPLKSAPPKIAQILLEHIQEHKNDFPEIDEVQNINGYLNFKLTPICLSQVIELIQNQSFLQPLEEKSEKVMIEYASPNTHKTLHVGHVRNLCLGDALIRINEHCGYKVIAANYVGDMGTDIAKSLWYMKEHHQGEIPEKHRGEFLGQMYTGAGALLDFQSLTSLPFPGLLCAQIQSIGSHPENENWKTVVLEVGGESKTVVCGGKGYHDGDMVVYAPVGSRLNGRLVEEKDMQGTLSQGAICSIAELKLGKDKDQIYILPESVLPGTPASEAGITDKGKEIGRPIDEVMLERNKQVGEYLQQLESGEDKMKSLWLETRQWSMDDFNEAFDWLGCRFDCEFYESEVGDESKEIILKALEDGKLIKSQGAIGADLSEHKLGFFMLLKSDGTGLYSTKDIALALQKFNEHEIDRSIYVVGNEQKLHFAQVFKTLELLGYPQAQKCHHLTYGLVNLPEGKMSSRKGTVIPFSKLRSLLTEHIMENYLEKYRGDWEESEIDLAARAIAVSAIRYGMLNQDNIKSIVFDIEDWSSPQGNTGPYLLYAYTRTRSILKEVPLDEGVVVDWNLLNDATEKTVMANLLQFRSIVERSGDQYKPQLMCIYLYELARNFSRMYEQCPVKRAENKTLQASRLKLVDSVGLVLKKGLNLLGIETLERM